MPSGLRRRGGCIVLQIAERAQAFCRLRVEYNRLRVRRRHAGASTAVLACQRLELTSQSRGHSRFALGQIVLLYRVRNVVEELVGSGLPLVNQFQVSRGLECLKGPSVGRLAECRSRSAGDLALEQGAQALALGAREGSEPDQIH